MKLQSVPTLEVQHCLSSTSCLTHKSNVLCIGIWLAKMQYSFCRWQSSAAWVMSLVRSLEADCHHGNLANVSLVRGFGGPFVSFNISPTDRDVGKEILILSYRPRLCFNYSNNSINVSFSFSFCWSQNLGRWHFTMKKKIPELQLSSLCNNFSTFGFDLTL